MSSPTIKTEFTEIITSSDLLPPRPVSISSSEEFPTIITESSLLEPPTETNDSQEEELKSLIDLYDDTFNSLETYRNFTNTKLAPWSKTLEYKYFDTLYANHRATSGTIRNLRRQARELLEEADSLSRRHYVQRRELEDFVSKLPQSLFQRRLSDPYKVYPRPPRIITERISKPPPSTSHPLPVPSTSAIRPLRPPYPSVTPRQPIRCFQCNSTLHIKWYCNDYRCRMCKKIAPGHSLKDCPQNQPEYYDDGQRGYFDIGGEENGNVMGEC